MIYYITIDIILLLIYIYYNDTNDIILLLIYVLIIINLYDYLYNIL